MPTPPRRTHATPERQEELKHQEMQETYRKLASYPEFSIFYAAIREKIEAARATLPTRIVTPDDMALYNELVGFIKGLEVVFDTVRFYMQD